MAHRVVNGDDDPGLAELRAICLAFPGAGKRISPGRPTFRAGKIPGGGSGSAATHARRGVVRRSAG